MPVAGMFKHCMSHVFMHKIKSLWASSIAAENAVRMLGTVCLLWLSPQMWLLSSLALSDDRTLLGEA